MDYIHTGQAPAPVGHYSQATRHGGGLFISGQLPIRLGVDYASAASAVFRDQALQAMTSMLAILSEAGGAPSNLAKVTAYIVGVENWPTFNLVYAELLGAVRPARSVVPVPALHHGFLIEIEAYAVGLDERAPRCL